jgi:hypothetical protein
VPLGLHLHVRVLASHDLLQRLHEILEDVEAIRHLQRLWRAARGPIRKVRAAVTTDDHDLRLRLQPGRERVRLAIRQEVNDVTPLEIDEERAVTMATADTPVIDTHHPWRRSRWQRCPSDLAQQRIGAHQQPQGAQKTRPPRHRA